MTDIPTTTRDLTGVAPGGSDASEINVLSAWAVLLRPRVALMVYITALIGALLAAGAGDLLRALEAALYVTLVTGAASLLNQVIERDTDARMVRTQQRPLVTGAVSPTHAIFGALSLAVLGTAGLVLSFQLLSAFLTLATLLTYVAIYTPLKRVSTLNTVVGAVAGAAPPLLGYVALAGQTGPWAWALFSVLFAWQFPHFMAIAWLYRADYARAGLHMIPAMDGADGEAGRQAVLYGIALLPVSLLPVMYGMVGIPYAAAATLLGGAYLYSSIRFQRREDEARARRLLYVSLVYLPVLYISILADPLVTTLTQSL